MTEPTDFLSTAVTKISDFATSYTTQALVIVGVAVAIGLGIWGFKKLVKLFRAHAG